MLTISEIERDIATYEARLRNPDGLTPQQLEIYRLALIEARQALAELKAHQQAAPVTAPPTKQPDPREYPITPIRVIKAGPISSMDDPASGIIIKMKNKPITTDHAPRTALFAARSADQTPTMRGNETITAQLNATPPTVTIEWPDLWGTQTYRESDIRSRLTSALRDLAQSRYARQERFDLLPSYLTWWRAKTFYRALCQFWPSPPGLAELGITRPGNTYRNIFNLIVG